jgi:DNA repair exonuclease SbcCD ATPase subunit
MRLEVKYKGKKYIDDIAQNIIEEKYGSYELFIASSYIRQGERNPLLTGTGKERSRILNQISFGNDDPSHYIDIVNEKIRDKKKDINSLNSVVEYIESDIKEEWKNLKGKDYNIDDPDGKLKGIKENIDRGKRILEHNSFIKRKMDDIDKKTSNLPDPIDIDKLNITDIESKITELEEEISILTSKQGEYILYMKYINNEPPHHITESDVDHTYTYTDYSDTIDKERIYNNSIAIFRKIGIEYTEGSKREYIDRNLHLLSLQEGRERYQKYISLKKKIDDINLHDKDKDNYNDEIKNLKSYLEGNRKINLVQCPSCNTELNMSNGKLEFINNKCLTDKEIADIKRKISSLEGEYRKYKRYMPLKYKLEQIDDTNMCEGTPLLNPKYVKDTIDKLESTCICNKPISPSVIKEYLDKKDNNEKYNAWLANGYLYTQRTDYSKDIKTKNEKLNKLKKELKYNISLKDREIRRNSDKEKLEKERYSISGEIKKEIDINSLHKEEKRIEKQIKYNETINAIKKKEKKLEKKNKILAKSNEHLSLYMRIRDIITEYQNYCFNSSINALNNNIHNMISRIFDKEISFKFLLNRETKKGDIKNEINIELFIGGQNSNSIKTLSGGEKDRISFITTISLSMIHKKSPLLIFDESLSSVDPNTKEECINILNDIVNHKSIWCINHDGVDGMYENHLYLT